MKSTLKAQCKFTTAITTILAAGIAYGAPVVAQDQAADGSTIEEISVTGSYIRRKNQQDTASPIQVVGRTDMQQNGITTISDFTNQLTINNGAQNNPDAFTQNLSTGTSNINLRGLGVGSTLILLNGKRTVASAAQTDGGVSFVDTASLIPPIAIEQVEVLKDGAGPLYGSDAVAGVVNFKTRSNFEGFEIEGEVKQNTDHNQRDMTIGAIAGWRDEDNGIRFMGSVNYFDRNNLSMRDRDLRSDEAIDNLISISTVTGFPGTFLLPTAPVGNLTDTLAFLFNYDNLMPTFENPLNAFGVPNTLPTGLPGAPLPPELAALGIVANSAPGYMPFPTVSLGGQVLTPGSVHTGYRPADPTQGEGVIWLPAFAAQVLGLGSDAMSIGADGVADALTGLTYSQIYAMAGPIVAQQLGVDPSMLDFAVPAGAEGAALPIFMDPYCMDVAATYEDVIPNGTPFTNPLDGTTTYTGSCMYDFNNQFDLVPKQNRLQSYFEYGMEFGDHEFYSNFSYARNRATRGNSNFPITQTLPILAHNPFNVYRSTAFWLGRSPGLNFTKDRLNPNPSTHDSNTYRGEIGLKGEFDNGWTYDMSVVQAKNTFQLTVSDGLADRWMLATMGYGGDNCAAFQVTPGTNGCMFYNVFGNGISADASEMVPVLNADFSPALDGDGNVVMVPVKNSDEIIEWLHGMVTIDGKAKTTVVDGVTAGQIGDLGVAFGYQYRKESLTGDYDENTNNRNFLFVQGADDYIAKRDMYAVFTEVLYPVSDNMEVSAAVRYENYGSDVGDTIDPKLAIKYNPSPEWSLRATYSSSFRAPSIFQQFGNQTSLNSVNDPRSSAEPFIAIQSRGTANLAPESADTFTAGFTWQPVDGFTFDVNFWKFEFNDVVVQESPQDLVNRALVGGETDLIGNNVILDPTDGSILAVLNNYRNASYIKTDGVDISASYVYEPDGDYGMVDFSTMFTYVNSYKLPFGNQTLDGAGSRNKQNFADPVPELRGQAAIGWAKDNQAARLTVRYVGSFTDDQNSVYGTLSNGLPDYTNLISERKVGSHTTVDLNYSYNLEDAFGMSNATINMGAINLFDQRPPAILSDGGFETRTHDPRGRMVYLGLRAGF